ncbi:MAG: hypothetical protein NC340_07525 [Ruminococcus flavefaciens]|nr:hypothetical protein [Ruminococcus flavefaciens]MCM1229351.1 hypothetical protein [Ruminococcus flavefaciens]
MLKKKFALAVIISVLASVAVGCGNTEGSSSAPDLPENSVADTTEAPTEPETEPETTEATEPETTATTEEVTTEAVTEPISDDVMTVGEMVYNIDVTFGMGGTPDDFAGNLSSAQAWDIIDTDNVPDETAPVTAELLISSAMRATGFVNGTSTLDEILECAVSYGVIDSADISAVDVAKADEIIEKAYDAWLHPNFETNISVVLADGVVDLTNVIPFDEITYADGTVSFPAEYADGLEAGTVAILPDDTMDGTAYKITAIVVTADNVADLTITPASIEEVYGSIISE